MLLVATPWQVGACACSGKLIATLGSVGFVIVISEAVVLTVRLSSVSQRVPFTFQAFTRKVCAPVPGAVTF